MVYRLVPTYRFSPRSHFDAMSPDMKKDMLLGLGGLGLIGLVVLLLLAFNKKMSCLVETDSNHKITKYKTLFIVLVAVCVLVMVGSGVASYM